MALERVPADIRVEGGVARMSDPSMIKEIMEAVTIPVMAKARIGHFVECQVCESSDHHRFAGEGQMGLKKKKKREWRWRQKRNQFKFSN
jgi:hypothetical protein